MFKYKSCAKLNSYLNITGKLANGYHALNTHFQLIDLFDEIEFSKSKTFSLKSNTELSEQNNSISNAINWFNKKFNFDQNFNVSLKKNIPIGGGLGGGSSNCATTLKFLCEFHSISPRILDFNEICFDLGADVPIFLHGKSAFAEGCGHIFAKNYSHNSKYLLVVPDISISTKELFRSTELKMNPKIDRTQNSFFSIITKENREFHDFIKLFCSNLPKNTQKKLKLSGTGSTLFIENPIEDEIQLIKGKIENNFRVFQVKGLEYYH